MTKDEMLEIFKECSEVFASANMLDKRIAEAEENIILLQEETQKLKTQRPTLLADNKDVSKINKRLKSLIKIQLLGLKQSDNK